VDEDVAFAMLTELVLGPRSAYGCGMGGGLVGVSANAEMLLDERRIIREKRLPLPDLVELADDMMEVDDQPEAALGDRRLAGKGGTGGSTELGGARLPTDELRRRRASSLSRCGDGVDGPAEKRFQNFGFFSRRFSVEGDAVMVWTDVNAGPGAG
jgi:hypothetical protein